MEPPFIKLIANIDHYNDVLARVASVEHSLWIGTADIKDVYVKSGNNIVPLLSIFDRLVKRGINIRLIHAKEPGPAFKEDYERFPSLKTNMKQKICPRVHFKIMVFDNATVYVGSANLTGAGIGMKSANRRNFEAGLLTNELTLVHKAADIFDSVWQGNWCKNCGRKQFCKSMINLSGM